MQSNVVLAKCHNVALFEAVCTALVGWGGVYTVNPGVPEIMLTWTKKNAVREYLEARGVRVEEITFID